MNCFEILGISPTKDVKAIRRAYSKLLTKFSPENDPEGFQRLRAAYEEALLKANEEEEETIKKLSPIDEFMESFEGIYKDYEKRVSLTYWKELLEQDICYNIDDSKEVSDRILTFIMDNYNFTSEVWKLFNDYFSWDTKKDKLYESFPKGFIDFVIYKITTTSTFDYEVLKQCKDNEQDLFIKEFRRLNTAVDDLDFYTASAAMKEAKAICPDHPDLKLLIGRYYMINGNLEEAESLFTNLINTRREAIDTYYYRGELYSRVGKLKEAYDDYKVVLSIDPIYVGALYSIGRCCISLKQYQEAIEYLEKLKAMYPYNQDTRVFLASAYNFYKDNLIEAMAKDSYDNNVKYKLAEAYFKTDKLEESYNLLKALMEGTEITKDMHYLYCQVLMLQKDYQLAYNSVSKGLETFKDDYKLNLLKADILDDLGREEEALIQYDKTIAINEDMHIAYNNKAYVLNKLERYNEGLECANKSISLDKSDAHGFKNKAASLLGLSLYEDCLDACEEAVKRYQYFIEAYVIKMQAFIDIDLYDEALNVFNRTRDLGLIDSKLYYEKARALMYLDKDDEAIENCNLAIEMDESNVEFYYTKGCLYYNKENYSESIECFDITLSKDPHHGGAYFYKAHSLINLSKENEALEVIDSAINLKVQLPDRFYSLKASIMENFKRYEEAINEYKNAINCEPNDANHYYSAGYALSEIEQYDEALKYYEKSLELDPNQSRVYVNVSYCLYNLERFHECIEYCDKAIDMEPDYIVPHQNKGWALYRLYHIEEAEVECNYALKIDGNNLDVLLLKLRILMYKELYQEALVVCDRMLELSSEDSNVKNIKSEILSKINPKKSLFKSLFK